MVEDRALTCWATFSGPPDPDCCLECRNYPILQYALRSHQYFLKWETGASFLIKKVTHVNLPKWAISVILERFIPVNNYH